MLDKPTDELNELLSDIGPGQVDSYLKENRNYLADSEKTFYYYMTDKIKEKGIKLVDVYSFAGVEESYGGQVMRMEKHTKNRDLIIRFCVAAHFGWDETNRALKLYGFNELYSKNPRDACIIVAINNRIYDLAVIDDTLEKNGLQRLSVNI